MNKDSTIVMIVGAKKIRALRSALLESGVDISEGIKETVAVMDTVIVGEITLGLQIDDIYNRYSALSGPYLDKCKQALQIISNQEISAEETYNQIVSCFKEDNA